MKDWVSRQIQLLANDVHRAWRDGCSTWGVIVCVWNSCDSRGMDIASPQQKWARRGFLVILLTLLFLFSIPVWKWLSSVERVCSGSFYCLSAAWNGRRIPDSIYTQPPSPRNIPGFGFGGIAISPGEVIDNKTLDALCESMTEMQRVAVDTFRGSSFITIPSLSTSAWIPEQCAGSVIVDRATGHALHICTLDKDSVVEKWVGSTTQQYAHYSNPEILKPNANSLLFVPVMDRAPYCPPPTSTRARYTTERLSVVNVIHSGGIQTTLKGHKALCFQHFYNVREGVATCDD